MIFSDADSYGSAELMWKQNGNNLAHLKRFGFLNRRVF
jgi:hypothetical protein